MKKYKGATPGPWKAHFNVPTAIIEGHLIKADNDVESPIASLWVGGGIKGKPTQIANAKLIADAPMLAEQNEKMLAMLKKVDRCHKKGDSCETEFDQIKALIAEIEAT